MSLIPISIVCLALLALLDCTGAEGPQSLPIRSLAKGALSGSREARQEIIRKPADWETLWGQHVTSAGAATKIPAVDFSKEMVIVATAGTQRTGGHAIEIVRVEKDDKKLRVFIKQTAPPPGAMTLQVLTAPFHFVAVPRSDLPPEFVAAKSVDKK